MVIGRIEDRVVEKRIAHVRENPFGFCKNSMLTPPRRAELPVGAERHRSSGFGGGAGQSPQAKLYLINGAFQTTAVHLAGCGPS
jgi:hypothetical protein